MKRIKLLEKFSKLHTKYCELLVKINKLYNNRLVLEHKDKMSDDEKLEYYYIEQQLFDLYGYKYDLNKKMESLANLINKKDKKDEL